MGVGETVGTQALAAEEADESAVCGEGGPVSGVPRRTGTGRRSGLRGRIRRFFDERYDMETARRFFDKQIHKRLPPHTSWLHVFGSLSLLLFISQTITGILLLVYYRPTPEAAHKSIQYITAEVHFGWLYRQVHAWGASLMILMVVLHMMRTFFMGAYKKPRELTWVTGVFIFILTITFGFTGYLLPWNQISFWATTVGTESANKIPLIGHWLQYFLRGGDTVTGETLSRFFVVHVIILPWLLTGLIAVHLFLMRLNNLATLEPVGEEKPIPPERGIPFYPVHVTKEGVVIVLLFAVLVTLAVVWPWDIGDPADPLNTPEHIKPEWYFLPSYQLLKYFEGPLGAVLGIFACSVPFLLLLLWPFLDRSKERHPRKRPFAVGLGLVGVLAALVLGYLGHISETEQTFFGKRYHIDILGWPHPIEEDGASSAADPAGNPHEMPSE
ncbi:MAG: cytochrome bc complex cytochrome b subunit [Planctomycetota bacterium]|nr:MAG: cytochrome bc complex cytochrome b subunit [Planctomycetota bacterium]